MPNENVQLDVFVRNVLACMKEQRRSIKEVQEEYMKQYPPGFWRKQLSAPVSLFEIEMALDRLVSLGFLSTEITRFHGDEPLSEDIAIYFVTNKGRSHLLPKKK
jgi:hypothetical protein